MSRELDALVAEKVMGWKQSPVSNFPWQLEPPNMPGLVRSAPHYTTDPTADYEVLKYVRENWNGKMISDSNGDSYLDMWFVFIGAFDEKGGWAKYKPGDYSRAALKVLGEID